MKEKTFEMNQDSIIRPPVLRQPPSAQAPPNPSQPANATPEFREIIRNLMTEILQTDNSILHRDNIQQIMTDQTIDERFRDNISDMDKVPDVVRSLREFNGKHTEFSSWKKSVERILKIYEPSIGTPKYFGILNVIRNKIVGSADAALEAYNTPLNWKAISRCLTTHYADKRDLSTLEYQMTCLIQGRKTIQEFYAEVYTHLSLILNKISCMEINTEAMHVLTNTYRDKALDTFVRGLSGDLSRLLGMKEPSDLPEALHLCTKLENQNYRSIHANNQYNMPKGTNFRQIPLQQKPFIPPRKFQPQNHPFYPNLAYIPQPNFPSQSQNQQNFYQQPSYQQQFYQQPTYRQSQHLQPFYFNKPFNNQTFNNPPPRPIEPKPPVPMEVDQSLQTRNANYINRPNNNNYPQKRPPPAQSHQYSKNVPNKIQRVNHISQSIEPTTTETYNDYNNQDYNPGYQDQQWQDYYNTYEQQDQHDQYNENEYADVHFLD